MSGTKRGHHVDGGYEGTCSSEAGFTLVEILVTMIILAILFGIAASAFRGSDIGARANAVKTAAAQIDAAVQVYNTDFPAVDGRNPLVNNLGPQSPMTDFGTLPTNGLRSREGQPLMDAWPDDPYTGTRVRVWVANTCPSSGTAGAVYVCRAGTPNSVRVLAFARDNSGANVVAYDKSIT